MPKPYFRPLNAGLASEPEAAGRRVAKLLKALDEHVNGYICEGQIIEDIRTFRLAIMDNLKKQGWRVIVTGMDRYSVLPPKRRK